MTATARIASVLIIPAVLLGDIVAPSFTQGVLDVILAMIAAGIWRLVSQIRGVLLRLRSIEVHKDVVNHRLDNHRERLAVLDNKDEEPYYS